MVKRKKKNTVQTFLFVMFQTVGMMSEESVETTATALPRHALLVMVKLSGPHDPARMEQIVPCKIIIFQIQFNSCFLMLHNWYLKGWNTIKFWDYTSLDVYSCNDIQKR